MGFRSREARWSLSGIAFQTKRFGLVIEAARRLSERQACGWFQRPMEFAGRALGNRSILADPRTVTMRERINIKQREGFRPFAPAVTAADVSGRQN